MKIFAGMLIGMLFISGCVQEPTTAVPAKNQVSKWVCQDRGDDISTCLSHQGKCYVVVTRYQAVAITKSWDISECEP